MTNSIFHLTCKDPEPCRCMYYCANEILTVFRERKEKIRAENMKQITITKNERGLYDGVAISLGSIYYADDFNDSVSCYEALINLIKNHET